MKLYAGKHDSQELLFNSAYLVSASVTTHNINSTGLPSWRRHDLSVELPCRTNVCFDDPRLVTSAPFPGPGLKLACLTCLTPFPVIVRCLRSDSCFFGHYNRSCLLSYLNYCSTGADVTAWLTLLNARSCCAVQDQDMSFSISWRRGAVKWARWETNVDI